MVSDKELYPTFARTIFGDNSIGPSVVAVMKYFGWNRVGIISENEEEWDRRGQFLASFLASEGKTVALHEKIMFALLYKPDKHGAHYQDVLNKMKSEARSKSLIGQLYL